MKRLGEQQWPISICISCFVTFFSWKESFKDPESGIHGYKWCVGSQPGQQDIIQYIQTTEQCDEVSLHDKLIDGLTYYLTVHVSRTL